MTVSYCSSTYFPEKRGIVYLPFWAQKVHNMGAKHVEGSLNFLILQSQFYSRKLKNYGYFRHKNSKLQPIFEQKIEIS